MAKNGGGGGGRVKNQTKTPMHRTKWHDKMADARMRELERRFSEVVRLFSTFEIRLVSENSMDHLSDIDQIFTADFLHFNRKVQRFGGLLVITGESAVEILLNKRVEIPQVALAFAKDTQDGSVVNEDIMAYTRNALNVFCVEDELLRSTMETGRAHSVAGVERVLQSRKFNADALGFVLNADMELVLMDPSDSVAAILERTLEVVSPPGPDSLSLDESRRAIMLAARNGFRTGKLLKRTLSASVSAWNDVQFQDRGILLLEIMSSRYPSAGLILMHESLILNRVFPLLRDMAGVEEKVVKGDEGNRKYHHKDVFYHTMQVLDNVCELTDNVWLRFAALLHDVAKPRTKAFSPETGWTFHGHAEIGARMVKRMFREYAYAEEGMRYVRKLVALHLRPMALVSEGVTDSAVRRLITDVGDEMEDLLTLCRCDITSKNPGRVTRYLNNYDRLVDTIHDVLSRDRLREWQPPITGQEIMERCGVEPGVIVGVLKTHVENAILTGEIANTKEEAIAYLLQIKDEVLQSREMKKPRSTKQSLKSLPENLDK